MKEGNWLIVKIINKSGYVIFLRHINMKQAYKTDEELVAAIQRGGTHRERAFEKLYNDVDLKNGVIRMTLKNSGTAADGIEVFQEGIIILYRNVREGKYSPDKPLRNYLFGICRFYWNNLRNKNQKISLNEEDQKSFEKLKDEIDPASLFENEEMKKTIAQILEKQGDRCRKVLRMWMSSFSMKEIAEATGLKNDTQARKSKGRCWKNLVDYLKEQPELIASLKK